MDASRRRRRPCPVYRVARTEDAPGREAPAPRRAVIRVTLTSAVLIGAVAGCALAIEPLVRDVLDALAAVADGASWSVW